MWIWILLTLAGLLMAVFILGRFLPEEYESRGQLIVALAPDEVWRKLTDYAACPMAATMCRSVEALPDENGLPVWVENIGSSKIRVQTMEADPPRRIVRHMTDRVVPMLARSVIEVAPNERGACITMRQTIRIEDGTWHVAPFRVMMTLTGGVKSGVRAFLGQIAGTRRPRVEWTPRRELAAG